MNVLKYLIILSGFLILSSQSQGNDSGNQNPEISKSVISETIVNTDEQNLISFMTDYVDKNKSSDKIDTKEVVELLYITPLEYNISPLLLLALAHPESGFDKTDTGSAGEKGLIQIHTCHKRSMKKAGLDYSVEADRIRWGCMMIRSRLDNGKSLHQAIKPWGVSDRGNGSGPAAWKEYNKLVKEYEELYGTSKGN
jgi:hypothetical protein